MPTEWTITIPEIGRTELWWVLGILSVVYGFITHHHASYQVRKFNKKQAKEGKKQISMAPNIAMFFWRVIAELPVRILLGLGGILFGLTSLGIGGGLGDQSKWCFRSAWKWHATVDEIAKEWSE